VGWFFKSKVFEKKKGLFVWNGGMTKLQAQKITIFNYFIPLYAKGHAPPK